MNIITDLYEIKITSNKNNLNLNDICTITVQAIDFNGNNISGKNIKLEVDKGNFTNGNTTLGKSYTGTTDANGFTVSYKASESGIITFKTQIYTQIGYIHKNSNLQIRCDGWKRYTYTVTKGKDCYLYINDNQRVAFLTYTSTLRSFTGAGSAQTVETLDIPTQYRPPQSRIDAVGSKVTITWVLTMDGRIQYRVQRNRTHTGDTSVRFQWTF